jgi:hypothetical protein
VAYGRALDKGLVAASALFRNFPALQEVEWVVWPGDWAVVIQKRGEHKEKRSAARTRRSMGNPV